MITIEELTGQMLFLQFGATGKSEKVKSYSKLLTVGKQQTIPSMRELNVLHEVIVWEKLVGKKAFPKCQQLH